MGVEIQKKMREWRKAWGKYVPDRRDSMCGDPEMGEGLVCHRDWKASGTGVSEA